MGWLVGYGFVPIHVFVGALFRNRQPLIACVRTRARRRGTWLLKKNITSRLSGCASVEYRAGIVYARPERISRKICPRREPRTPAPANPPAQWQKQNKYTYAYVHITENDKTTKTKRNTRRLILCDLTIRATLYFQKVLVRVPSYTVTSVNSHRISSHPSLVSELKPLHKWF